MDVPGGREVHFKHLLYNAFRRGQSGADVARDICAVYGEGAMTEWTARETIAKFKNAGTLTVSVPEPLVPKKRMLFRKHKTLETKKELVPSLSDTSDLDGDDELSQISNEQQRLQQNHSRTRYCSKRKSDPRLPAGAAARLPKVPRQEQLDPSKSKVHSDGDEQSPIGSITVTDLTTGVGQRRSLRSRIGILNRRHRGQRQTPPIATSLENPSPPLVEQSIKAEIKDEVVDSEVYDQELGTIAPAQQMTDIVKENESLDLTLPQIKQEVKSEIIDEVDPDGLVQEQATSIAANQPRNVEDVKLLGV